MKAVGSILLALAAVVVGHPVPELSSAAGSLLAVRATGTGSTSSELETGACRPYTLIFARGTTEPGNMGGTVGPALCDALKKALGDDQVACQGVGDPYKAAILDNLLKKGTTDAAIGEATRLFTLARTKCPSTRVLASGYSQGGAVMHGSISGLPSDVGSMIAGAVMFGDSRNLQDKGRIPNFPTAKTRIICLPADLVCLGTDLLTIQHLLYDLDVGTAVKFVRGLLTGE